MPLAVNCWVLPAATDGLGGVTPIATRVAVVTVKVVLPLTLPIVADILAVPAVILAVASPALVIVATVVLSLAQVTSDVILAVKLSE